MYIARIPSPQRQQAATLMISEPTRKPILESHHKMSGPDVSLKQSGKSIFFAEHQKTLHMCHSVRDYRSSLMLFCQPTIRRLLRPLRFFSLQFAVVFEELGIPTCVRSSDHREVTANHRNHLTSNYSYAGPTAIPWLSRHALSPRPIDTREAQYLLNPLCASMNPRIYLISAQKQLMSDHFVIL